MTRVGVRRGVALAALVMVPLTACSGDEQTPMVAERPTTTNPTLAGDLEPTVAPPPPAQVVGAIESAVSESDFCALLAAIDAAEPSPTERDGSVQIYAALAKAADAARAFRPAELRADWEVAVTGIQEAAEAVEAHQGDIADPDVEAALTSDAMLDAIRNVERYQLANCPPPTP